MSEQQQQQQPFPPTAAPTKSLPSQNNKQLSASAIPFTPPMTATAPPPLTRQPSTPTTLPPMPPFSAPRLNPFAMQGMNPGMIQVPQSPLSPGVPNQYGGGMSPLTMPSMAVGGMNLPFGMMPPSMQQGPMNMNMPSPLQNLLPNQMINLPQQVMTPQMMMAPNPNLQAMQSLQSVMPGQQLLHNMPSTLPSPLAQMTSPLSQMSPLMPMHVPIPNPQIPTQAQQQPPTPTAPPAPPRPTVVLLLGVCGSGKTTLGRKLAAEHNFMFFSGGETLRTTFSEHNKEWMKRRLATEALNKQLDQLNNTSCREKGIVIDRQGKSVEDMFYLNSALRSRKMQLNAIIVLETTDDILKERLRIRNAEEANRPEGTDDHALNERIRATRAVMQRCVELFQQSHSNVMARQIDAGRDEQLVLADIRTNLASVLSPPIQQRISNFSLPLPVESQNMAFVEDVSEYATILERLMSLVQQDKGTKFPGTIVSSYVTKKFFDDQRHLIRDDYRVTRRYIGSRYLYMRLKAENKAYLIPRHMRCVYTIPTGSSWENVPLMRMPFADVPGDFVLDGDLIRATRPKGQSNAPRLVHEVFSVTDVLVWNGVSVTRRLWEDRHALINEVLHTEGTLPPTPTPPSFAFTVRRYYDIPHISDAMKVGEYASDGIIFQHKFEYRTGLDDKLHIWKPPSAITCDFRVGAVERTPDGVKRVHLEVLQIESRERAKYVPFNEIVEVEPDQYRRHDIHFGAIVECSVFDPTDPRRTKFKFCRVAPDKTSSHTNVQVQEIIQNTGQINANKLIELLDPRTLQQQQQQPTQAPATGLASRSGWGTATAEQQAARPETGAAVSRPPRRAPQENTPSNNSTLDRWANIRAHGEPTATTQQNQQNSELRQLQQVVGGNVKQPLSGIQIGGPPARSVPSAAVDATALERTLLEQKKKSNTCYQCGFLDARGHVDQADGKFYCYGCWFKLGFGECEQCREFSKVETYGPALLCEECSQYFNKCHECSHYGEGSMDNYGDFFCQKCWSRWEREGSSSQKSQPRRKGTKEPRTSGGGKGRAEEKTAPALRKGGSRGSGGKDESTKTTPPPQQEKEKEAASQQQSTTTDKTE